MKLLIALFALLGATEASCYGFGSVMGTTSQTLVSDLELVTRANVGLYQDDTAAHFTELGWQFSGSTQLLSTYSVGESGYIHGRQNQFLRTSNHTFTYSPP